jgi:hypothetical protein
MSFFFCQSAVKHSWSNNLVGSTNNRRRIEPRIVVLFRKSAKNPKPCAKDSAFKYLFANLTCRRLLCASLDDNQEVEALYSLDRSAKGSNQPIT